MHSYMLLIGGSIPAMANILFFILIFFSLRIFLRLLLQYRGVTIV